MNAIAQPRCETQQSKALPPFLLLALVAYLPVGIVLLVSRLILIAVSLIALPPLRKKLHGGTPTLFLAIVLRLCGFIFIVKNIKHLRNFKNGTVMCSYSSFINMLFFIEHDMANIVAPANHLRNNSAGRGCTSTVQDRILPVSVKTKCIFCNDQHLKKASCYKNFLWLLFLPFVVLQYNFSDPLSRSEHESPCNFLRRVQTKISMCD